MAESSGADAAKKELVRKPPIETASWCYRDKEDDVHHDFAWTITNFSRKINMVPNGEYIESDKVVLKCNLQKCYERISYQTIVFNSQSIPCRK